MGDIVVICGKDLFPHGHLWQRPFPSIPTSLRIVLNTWHELSKDCCVNEWQVILTLRWMRTKFKNLLPDMHRLPHETQINMCFHLL